MRNSEALRAIKDVLSRGFCQDALAMDKDGNFLIAYPDVRSDKAVAWCFYGAMVKLDILGEIDVAKYVEQVIDDDSVVNYNNTHSQEEMLSMLDKAIILAEKEESNV